MKIRIFVQIQFGLLLLLKLTLTNNNIGDDRFYRKPEILVDAIELMLEEDLCILMVELFMMKIICEKGISNFKKYRCHEDFEPPKIKDVNHLMKN